MSKTITRQIKPATLPGTTSDALQDYEIRHMALARRAAAEGFVLLENKNGLLPLQRGCRLALYGAGASQTIKGGTGSGDVNERHSMTIYEGLREAGFELTTEDWIREYDRIYDKSRLAWRDVILAKANSGDPNMYFFNAYSTTPFYLPAGPEVTPTGADTAVYVLSRIAGENADRTVSAGDYLLSDEEESILADICRLYPHVILLINTGGVVDLSFLDKYDKIEAVLYISQPGMEGGNAVADVLTGAVTPCGKLTDTWALHYDDYPTAPSFREMTSVRDKACYREGIYVGYRYFDSFDVPARHLFGDGLSYTTFSIEETCLQTESCGNKVLQTESGGQVIVRARVTNTGTEYSGREVVQLYASLPGGSLEKEKRRLAAFAKTKVLAPGESQEVILTFTAEDLASYAEDRSAWILEPGLYGLWIGGSLRTSSLCAALSLAEEKVLALTAPVCPLLEELEELHRTTFMPGEPGTPALPEGLPLQAWDLSGVETVITEKSENNPEADESGISSVEFNQVPGTDLAEVEALVRTLSTDQLIHLAVGRPMEDIDSALGAAGISVPGSAGETSGCALDQGVAPIVMADGPAGLRLCREYYVRDGHAVAMPPEASLEHGLFADGMVFEGEKRHQFCTAVPVGTLLAQTWDPALIEEIGDLIGDEMQRFGVTLWLAPGMNIHRDPLCGRNFEYYSEDPLLSGLAAAAVTRGVQRHPGCGTTIKHFCCNNQEDNRMFRDSVVSERALREIYLRGFGIAIRRSHPLSMMTSYNLINGIHAANSYDLCTRIAREEFGFDGFIMTDWTTTEQGPDCTAAGCIRAGNDLIMPGRYSDHDSIRGALADGSLSLDQLRACVTRIVRVILQSDRYVH